MIRFAVAFCQALMDVAGFDLLDALGLEPPSEEPAEVPLDLDNLGQLAEPPTADPLWFSLAI